MAGTLILLGLLVALIAFDLAAWHWGVDSTDAYTNLNRLQSPICYTHARRHQVHGSHLQ